MKRDFRTGTFLALIALIFTIGLTFASVELPVILDKVIGERFNFPNLATGQDEAAAFKEELYIARYNIRLIGYICLALVIGLIAAGFILEKKGLASAGAIVLFLPVFGRFAATMFFLGGLALLRFLWLPFLDISFDSLTLGDAVLLPFQWILRFFRLFGLNLWKELPFIITGLGLFIFLLGVIAWLHGRVRKHDVTDFWIYRFSRHPQYAGWIIWSYGVLFLPGADMKRYTDVPNSLPWLLTAMVIIGIAMMEERRMRRDFGKEYDSFRDRAPFLFPLPRFLRKCFSLPLKLIFKTRYPNTKGQIAAVTGFYTLLLIAVSLFTGGLLKQGERDLTLPEIAALTRTVRTADNRNDIRNSADRLSRGGEAAIDSLILLLQHPKLHVRWYCTQELGETGSLRAVEPLLLLLDDPDSNVRQSAAEALGAIGSEEAVEPLITLFLDPARQRDDSAVARALGRLGSPKAVQPLLRGLEAEHPVTRRWSAWALAELGAEEAVDPIIRWFENDLQCDYSAAGKALLKLGSDRAEDAFITGLAGSNMWSVAGCVTELGKIGTERSRAAVIDVLKNHPESSVRRAAVLALGEDASEQARAALKEALEDEDFEVRLYAEGFLKSAS